MVVISDIYSSVKLSLFKVCNTFATDIQTLMSLPAAPSLWNFDAFSEENKLPDGDIVGLRGYSMDIDTELVKVRTQFGLATENDIELMRLDAMTAVLLKRLLPDTDIPIYDSQTKALAANLRVGSGVSVSPVIAALQRPCKFIALEGFLSAPAQP